MKKKLESLSPSDAVYGSASSCVQVAVETLSRNADARWGDDPFFVKRPVQYGPLTPNIADYCGMQLGQARYHLTRLWRSGKIEKHISYAGCTARWYSRQNV